MGRKRTVQKNLNVKVSVQIALPIKCSTRNEPVKYNFLKTCEIELMLLDPD